MDGVVEGLEGLGTAAEGVAEDISAKAQEIVVEPGKVLEVRVFLPICVDLACLEGEGGVRLGLPYKNESRSDF